MAINGESVRQFIKYRASAKGALAQGAISSTGTNSPSQVFYGNQFFAGKVFTNNLFQS